MNETIVNIESHEKAGFYIRVNHGVTAELREYLIECRFPFAINTNAFSDIRGVHNQDIVFFGCGVRKCDVWEVLSGFFDGCAEVEQ